MSQPGRRLAVSAPGRDKRRTLPVKPASWTVEVFLAGAFTPESSSTQM